MAVLNLNDDNFKKEVLDYQGVVLVDFWAPWCGPCQIMGPILEQFAQDYQGKVKVAKVNVDENRTLASQYQIMSIPALIVFQGGKVVDQLVGIQPKELLAEKIDPLLKKEK